ncbi:SRPBCC family protein [Allokutzneria multivorans]|uniref:SRPBCC family protein n=1 Tax=Allokutzneria multivorans TaxID=1142134 RepID=A0ABP7T2C0_9PSEU
MTTTTRNETTIEADPDLPTIRITREFDAPAAKVFRAYTDPELYAKWIGPRSVTTEIQDWNASTGGNYRFTNSRNGEVLASFYGSFHEVRDGERLVQTFTYDGYPDGVSLETMTFEDLGDGRSRVVGLSVVDTMEARDAMIASGMETGVVEGYQKLDELLTDL